MITSFAADSANSVWQQAAQTFRSGGGFRDLASRSGQTQELLHATFSISNPRERWVTSRSPGINPAFAIAEIVWILGGRNDVKFLQFWNSKIGRYSDDGSTFHGAYGNRLRRSLEIDQIERAYQILRSKPNTRQLVLQIWDAELDLPDESGSPKSLDVPCNVMSLVKLRDGRLEWLQVLRSNDLYMGVPYNFVQFTHLQEILAGWLGVKVGSYNQISDSLHIYDDDIENVKASLPLVAESNSDDLALPKETSKACFAELERRIEGLISADLNETQYELLSNWPSAPQSFKNLLSVLSAESARRREWFSLANESAQMNTNPALIQMWNRWIERFS